MGWEGRLPGTSGRATPLTGCGKRLPPRGASSAIPVAWDSGLSWKQGGPFTPEPSPLPSVPGALPASPSLQLKHSLKKKKKNLNDAKGFLRFNSPHSPIYFEGVDNICKGIKSQNPVSLKFVFSSYSFVFLCAFTNVTWPAWGQALRTPPSGTSASSPKPLGPRR